MAESDNRSVLRELGDNVETMVTYGPHDQDDASEPRAKMLIVGPKRLLDRVVAEISWQEGE